MSMKKNFRQNVAEEMIRHLEAGTAPWQKPWDPGVYHARPFNPTSNKSYHGINAVILDMSDYSDPRWMTFRQARDLDAQVQGGEKATMIEYWKWTDTKKVLDAAGKPVMGDDGKPLTETIKLTRPQVFYASVFNAEQIDGLAPYKAPPLKFEPVIEAEAVLKESGIPIIHDQDDRAFYTIFQDQIHLPDRSAFPTAYDYYATALHEVGHATGHKKRMNREFGPFGSETYAREELKAEMASYMVSRELGLGHNPERHAGYLESWLKAIKDDRNFLFQAALDAERITTWVMEPEKRQVLENAMQKRSESHQSEQVQEQEQETSKPRTYLAVPFEEKDAAKALGAKWDRKAKSWYTQDANNTELMKWKSETAPESEKAIDPAQEFAQALKDHGIVVKGDPVMDGKWQRASLTDEPGKQNASYRAFLDGIPNGQIKNFKTDELHTWVSAGEPLSDKERAVLQAQAAETRAVRAEELVQAQHAAAKKAFGVWKNAHAWADQSNSEYLQRKDVQGYGIKVDVAGRLLIPARDTNGRIHSLQTIDDTGKAFLKNGRKGGMMHVIDPNKEMGATGRIIVAEGYATAATLHEATGNPVVSAFDSGNLKAVVEAVKSKHPDAEMVIAADNDHQLDRNVGLTKAIEAAKVVGGRVIEPPLSEDERTQGLTDWNDLAQSRGKDAVAKLIKSALSPQSRQKSQEQEMVI
ncbi:MAG: zincin-like metallopeptidase domain-containing protein [Alphaproteobacteria bacterium]